MVPIVTSNFGHFKHYFALLYPLKSCNAKIPFKSTKLQIPKNQISELSDLDGSTAAEESNEHDENADNYQDHDGRGIELKAEVVIGGGFHKGCQGFAVDHCVDAEAEHDESHDLIGEDKNTFN